MHPCVHCSIIHGGQDIEATQVSFDSGLDEEGVVHLHNGTLLSREEDEMLPFATTWMAFENFMLSEISHSEKAKTHMTSPTCGT